MSNTSTPGSTTTSARGRIFGAAMRLFAERGGDALTVSELAEAAGIARGTIYNNIRKPENLFGEVANALASEMIQRTEAAMEDLQDPAARIATGLRLFVRRAHEEMDWGRFLVRFGLAHSALQNLMAGPPARDIANAIKLSRFKADAASVPAMVTLLNGATMASMHAVIEGEQTWREAGSVTAELFLCAGGMARREARSLSRSELPTLPEAPQKKPTRSTAGRPSRERH
ncbi:MAG: helix-turn-helix domain-containing protein [Hyphomonadaceae bacterium]